MNLDIHQEISRRLLQDYSFKHKGQWLREGRCPSCSKKELFTHAEHPWVLKCGRESKCGWQGHVKELYPEVFASWSDRFKATEEDPTAAATAYLQFARGLNTAALGGCYEQGNYWDSELKIGSATVRFLLPGGWWERLIDRPERFGKKKAVFKFGTEYQGTWWVPPHLDLAKEKEIWIVEGIFNALALRQNGITAVASLTCNNYPEKALAELMQLRGQDLPRLVWALDSDAAGRRFTLKWVEQARAAGWDCAAAQIPQRGKGKVDWNDLHQREQLGHHDLEKYRYHGALLIAEDASEKALLIYKHTTRKEFAFDYRQRLYWFRLDLDKFNKAQERLRDSADSAELTDEQIRNKALEESGGIALIANCSPQALYFQANALTDESWYYIRVDFPHGGPSVKSTFTGGQLASASEFKKRMMSIAPGALYTGSSQQLDKLLADQLFNIKTVQTVDYIGFSKDHGCYVFGELAVKDGQLYELNEEDFFDLGKLSIKSLNQSVALSINNDTDAYSTEWVKPLYVAFGAKGMVALAFWFGTLFAEQIRGAQKSYPFLEVVGQAGAGKSTLIEFMWKLLGRRDYEGFDPSKATLPARARNFAQVSNLPVVLIEADRESDTAKSQKFDWDELKTAYNGRSVRARGVKSSGNETYEPPFRGSIVIAQNADVNASEAILTRIVHLHFDRTTQTPETKAMADKLENWPLESLSGFTLAAIRNEKAVMEIIAQKSPVYVAELQANPQIKNIRIVKNHALMMALVDALATVIQLPASVVQKTHAQITAIAIERQVAVNADHPIVQGFWEVFDFINSKNGAGLNHAKEAGLIAVNLNHFLEEAAVHKQQVPLLSELKHHLKTSRVRKYMDQKVVSSRLWKNGDTSQSVRCWVFKDPEGETAK